MLGIAIRIAQRIGIDSESALSKCTPFEAEMRRRLWWSLTLFDNRISEMANFKASALAPTWSCKVPLNVSDFDLRPGMKEPPPVPEKPTEALFAVVRSELGEFIRHTEVHLDFTNPVLKTVTHDVEHGSLPRQTDLGTLERMIDDKYLNFCDPENPLHFMTIWTTRASLAKCRLVEHLWRYSCSSVPQAKAQRNEALPHALDMLECDTKIMASPLTKGFLWISHYNFPFLAYIHLLQDLRRHPVSEQAEQAWEVMSGNYEARFSSVYLQDIPLFKMFSKMILAAWEPREKAFKQLKKRLILPSIVSSIRHKLAQIAQNTNINTEESNELIGMGIDNFPMSMPIGFDDQSLLYSMMNNDGYTLMEQEFHSEVTGHVELDVHMNELDWAAMDWGFGGRPGS